MLSRSPRRIVKKNRKAQCHPKTEPRIPFPKAWQKHVRSSLLHVISLAQFAAAYTRGWGADSTTPRLRHKTELLCLTATIVLQRNRSGSDRKPWLKNRPKYSDEPSYRIRQNLQIRSERLRSMLRKVDRVLADSTKRQPKLSFQRVGAPPNALGKSPFPASVMSS